MNMMTDYMDLNLTTEIYPEKEGIQVVDFKGNLDKVGLQSVEEKIEKLVDEFAGKFMVFNYADLEFTNSEGIGFLLTLQAKLVKKNAKLIVIAAKDHVKDVFNVIGMTKIIDCYESMPQFMESIKS